MSLVKLKMTDTTFYIDGTPIGNKPQTVTPTIWGAVAQVIDGFNIDVIEYLQVENDQLRDRIGELEAALKEYEK